METRKVRLNEKIAIVVGAGQSAGEGVGIGRATAITFAREGARVAALDFNLASAEETAHAIVTAGGTSLALKADVTDEASLAAAFERVRREWGRIDILHNNVGIGVGAGDRPLLEITKDIFDRIYAVNLLGVVLACKQAVPVMREQKEGVITNTSSAAALGPAPNVAYKATKAALIPFTQQLALQNAPFGIRANVILPGPIDTPMGVDARVRQTGKTRAEITAELDATVPLRGRQGTPWDVANAALFLASKEADFISGVALPVDGARLLKG
jgi:NAD(P)-dependent dehydrogenase (short-subunit alcohol dehydrogenase family)